MSIHISGNADAPVAARRHETPRGFSEKPTGVGAHNKIEVAKPRLYVRNTDEGDVLSHYGWSGDSHDVQGSN